MTATPWRTWQLADSGFPIGGFAHSAGLEAAAQCGALPSGERLEEHLRAHAWNAGHAVLPFVGAGFDAPADIDAIDDANDALLTSHVANRASRAQGRALAATCARIYDAPALASLAARSKDPKAHSHFAPLFGVALRALDVPREEALGLHLHLSLRGVLSAAVRLGLVGPLEAQRLQTRLATTLDAVLAECASLPLERAATVAPLIDLMGATHDRLYVRLFQS